MRKSNYRGIVVPDMSGGDARPSLGGLRIA
jgi:hypothetical protein